MPYEPSSKVLFVSICSLNKAEGGSRNYARSDRIAHSLPAAVAQRLRQRRESARQQVVGMDSPQRQGVEVSELPYNDQLVRGQEFGGNEGAPLYLPAVERYKGRFFLGLGQDRLAGIRNARHHVLILSGLYGIVRPLEPIQLYSCPLDRQIAELWRTDELLTEVVGAYVGRHGIKRVIDLTAMEAYRNLVDWRNIGRDTDVLHCFWSGGAGADALIPFGETLRQRLLEMSEHELLQLRSDHRVGQVICRSAPRPGEDFPEEPNEDPYDVESVEEVLAGGIASPADAESGDAWRFSATRQFQRDVRREKGLFEKPLACPRTARRRHRRNNRPAAGRSPFVPWKATNAIIKICADPLNRHGNTIKPLSGTLKGLWRYRLDGDFRLIYRPDTKSRVIHCQRLVKRDSHTYQDLT